MLHPSFKKLSQIYRGRCLMARVVLFFQYKVDEDDDAIISNLLVDLLEERVIPHSATSLFVQDKRFDLVVSVCGDYWVNRNTSKKVFTGDYAELVRDVVQHAHDIKVSKQGPASLSKARNLL